MLYRVRHGVVGGFRRSRRGSHSVQRRVELLRSRVVQRQGSDSCFRTAPQFVERARVPVDALSEDCHHVAQRTALFCQLRKRIARLFNQGRANRASAVSEFVEHGFQIRSGFRRGNAAFGKLRVCGGQIVHFHAVSRRERDNLANGRGQFIDGRFAEILRGNEHIGNVFRLSRFQPVSVQSGCKNVHRRGRRRKSSRREFCGGSGKFHGGRRVHACGNRRVDRFRKSGNALSGFTRQSGDLGFDFPKADARGVRNRGDFGNADLERRRRV